MATDAVANEAPAQWTSEALGKVDKIIVIILQTTYINHSTADLPDISGTLQKLHSPTCDIHPARTALLHRDLRRVEFCYAERGTYLHDC